MMSSRMLAGGVGDGRVWGPDDIVRFGASHSLVLFHVLGGKVYQHVGVGSLMCVRAELFPWDPTREKTDQP